MIKKVGDIIEYDKLRVKFGDVEFNKMFNNTLEYSSPARGTWNISHTGMLIPESHQIFVCAANCLRGVILTAAEIHSMNRFSTIEMKEHMIYDGSMEQTIIDGVEDILKNLNYTPRIVLVYTSCMHHFLGTDLEMIYSTLREKFKNIEFVDCYMNPTLRKSGITPDETMRVRLYRGLKKKPLNKNTVLIAGNDLPMKENNDILKLLKQNNVIKKEITDCKNYDEYLDMADSSFYITTFMAAKRCGEDLEYRLGGKQIYLTNSFDYDEIKTELKKLSDELNIKNFDDKYYEEQIKLCEEKLAEVKNIVGDKKIAIDYTYCSRPLSLAKLLLTHGFNVDRVYADSFTKEEENDFNFIKQNYPNVFIYPTINANMLYANSECKKDEFLAIGQKAAFFTNTDHFVNVIVGGGMFGFEGIIDSLELMKDAYLNTKDMISLVKIKGLGCEECVVG